jgi:hypothetical protein
MSTPASTRDDDPEEWHRLWSGKTQRQIQPPILFGVSLDPRLGAVECVTVSQAPEEFLELLESRWLVGAETPLCPICGATTIGTPRLFASLHLSFECGLKYGQCVCVHPACFESCVDTGMPAPIPW